MGEYQTHVFVCASGETCPTQGDVEQYVTSLRAEAVKAGVETEVRINKAGCFSECGHGPMIVVYPENVWYAGVRASDLEEIVKSTKGASKAPFTPARSTVPGEPRARLGAVALLDSPPA